MSAILGRATIKVDGKILLTKPGAELDIGGEKRTPVVGPTGVHGYTTENMAPMLSVPVSKRGDVSVKDLDAIKSATILFEGDDGSRFVLSEAFRTETVKLKETGGEISMSFSATRCDPL